MRVITAVLGLLVLVSCGTGNPLENKSEKELMSGIDQFEKQLNDQFNSDSTSSQLKAINDSIVAYYSALKTAHPKSEGLAKACYQVAVASTKLKNGDLVVANFDALKKEYPNFKDMPKALIDLAHFYQYELKDLEKAVGVYKEVYKNYKDSPWAKSAKNQVLFIKNPKLLGE